MTNLPPAPPASPMKGLAPPGHRSREAERRARRRKRVGALVVIGSLLVVALGVWGFLRRDSGPPDQAAPGAISPTVLAIAVQGLRPLTAIVSVGGPSAPTAVSVPEDVVFVVPGQGELTAADAARLPGGAFRTGVSNMLGTWADHYAVFDRDSLTALVERSGGIEVSLSDVFETETGPIGPGTVTMTGQQVNDYLGVEGSDLDLHWDIVLQGLFAEELLLLPTDLLDSDDPLAVSRILQAAQGAGVTALPVNVLQSLTTPDYPAIHQLVGDVFGRPGPAPIPVIVTNGSGEPGVGQAVAARIIPAGFRVVISDNAEEFGRKTTQIQADGESAIPLANEVLEALGVGQVVIQEVPSGLAELTILVGKDLSKSGSAT
ncbi:MAG: LCP family protein [Actinomycetota bacterium]